MKLHRNAKLSVKGRELLVDRVENAGWSLTQAAVLRDEGEAYAAKVRRAGVPVTTVRYDGTIHDFMLLNSMSQTRATRAAVAQAIAFLRQAFGTD